MLPLLRPILRRPPRLKVKLSHPVLPLRLQHGNHGPHKEYFQDPSQFPSHAYQVKIPPPEQRARTTQYEPSPEQSGFVPPPTPKRLSLLRRFLRSALIVGLSITIGGIVGTAVITWDYIQPPFERGSEQEQDLIEEIDEMLDTCTLIHDLQVAGFQEDKTPDSFNSGQNLVTGVLNDVQGFKRRFFRHPKFTNLSVMVFFAGFGIEGWPDTVHGGAITTIMTEAAQQHLAPAFEQGDIEPLPSGQYMSINFRAPVRPAEIYAVLVHEQGVMVRPRELDVWSELGGGIDIEDQAVAHGLMTYLLSMETFPPDIIEGVRHEEITAEGLQLDPPGPGKMTVVTPSTPTVSLLTLPDTAVVHTTVSLDVMSRSKNVVREDGEDLPSYATRLRDEIMRVLSKVHNVTDMGTALDDSSKD